MPEAPDRQSVTAGTAGQFFLEIAGLIGIGRLGWHLGEGAWTGLALAALFVAIAGVAWGVFRTRGYVPAGGDPVIAIPGAARLVLELGFFVLATWGLWLSGWRLAAIVMIACVVVVYWALRERTTGLLHNRSER